MFGQKPPGTVTIITEQIEVDGPVGRMIAALLLGLGEIKLDYRRERQMDGIEVAKKKGLFLGCKEGRSSSFVPEAAG
jgi:DNA invertase Pin-like site-specific DNA recombinase